jgi:6-phosphogluconolactonase
MRFKVTLILTALLIVVGMSFAQSTKSHLLIGTYTNTGKSVGIYVFEFDPKTGHLAYKSVVAVSNPSYLTVSPDRKHVYSVSEDHAGTINAFNFDPATGKLAFLNKRSSAGDEPAYVSVDATGRYVFAANYTSGNLSAIPVQRDGSLGYKIQSIRHTGSSIDKSRQEAPHVHSIVVSPDNHYVITMDLGTDKTDIYSFDQTRLSWPLKPAPQPFIAIKAGSGPRHFIFHPNSKYAYGINELNSTISTFNYSNGHLNLLQTVSMFDKNYIVKGEAADIHISDDGKFLYGSNRGDANEIVIYSIDQNSGKLTYVGRQSSLGKSPRNFAIDLTGNFLLVANQDTNNIFVFKRDQKTGLLTATGQKINIGSPVCLKFVKIDPINN